MAARDHPNLGGVPSTVEIDHAPAHPDREGVLEGHDVDRDRLAAEPDLDLAGGRVRGSHRTSVGSFADGSRVT